MQVAIVRTVGSIIKLSIMVPKAFQAGYPNTTGFRKVVKATIYIKKKDGMSDEDFVEYYNTKHAQSAVPILQRHEIISYSLVMLLLNFVKHSFSVLLCTVSQRIRVKNARVIQLSSLNCLSLQVVVFSNNITFRST
jgi:hypothetical protein